MKVLHKFVIKSYLGPMVLTFFIVLFIFLMQFLWLYIDEIVGKGLEVMVIAELMSWVSLAAIPMALPLATLFASLMAMGNMGENNELLAIKAAGISLQRTLKPLFVLVFIVVVIGGFFASNNLVPYANLKMRSLLYDVKKKRPELAIPEGIFYNGMDGYSIRIGRKDPATQMLRDVMVYDHRSNRGNLSLTLADSGYIRQTPDQQNLILILFNGMSYEERIDNQGRFTERRGFTRRWFEEQTALISLAGVDFTRTDENLFSGYAQMKNIVQLDYSYDSLSNLQNQKAESFTRQMTLSSTFFEHAPELDTAALNPDRYRYAMNTDSIFERLPALQKIQVADFAISKVDNAKLQLDTYAAEYEIRRKEVVNTQIEWHRKFTLSIACIIFFFIGAPLGAIIRKGGLGMPAVVSIFFFVVYWVVDITCKKMAQSGAMNPVIATWFSSLILAPIAVFLTYKATTDSSLFNPDKYFAFFNKIFGRMKKLIRRIDLDDIVPSAEPVSILELEAEILEINDLCRQYESRYKLDKNIIWSLGVLSMSKGQDELNTIDSKYNTLIKQLINIDDNERLREQLRQYPELKAENYKVSPTFIKLLPVFLILGVVLGLAMYILVLNKRKKLRYVINEIVDINNTVSVILERK